KMKRLISTSLITP
ncbi:fucosyltransferase, partial [Helicobacter pylori]